MYLQVCSWPTTLNPTTVVYSHGLHALKCKVCAAQLIVLDPNCLQVKLYTSTSTEKRASYCTTGYGAGLKQLWLKSKSSSCTKFLGHRRSNEETRKGWSKLAGLAESNRVPCQDMHLPVQTAAAT